VLVLVAVSRYYDGRDVWQAWGEGRELRQPNYAERIYQTAVFRTRANTWSNLAYVVVGLYACAAGWRDRRGRVSPESGYVARTPALSFFFGLSCCYLGVGSGLYHASLTRWGQQLDVASMYAPLLAALVMQGGRMIRERCPNRVAWPWLLLVALAANVLLYRFKWSMSSTTVLTTLILLLGAGGGRDLIFAREQIFARWQIGAWVTLLAAIACRQLDVAGKFSGPDTWLQGHACWHGFTALSLACLYAYQRDERAGPPNSG
ncbi:MAG: ceramidase domain-containing protein, partial [Verrucomicrobiota bacterium]